MAEMAASALVAEQAVSTTLEAVAVGGVAIAQPTAPLKATFQRIGSAPNSDSPDSLSRALHTLTHINGDLYIYGGRVGTNKLAGPEMHILKLSSYSDPTSPGGQTSYKTVPPLSSNGADSPIPSARASHTAVTPTDGPHKNKVIVFGGTDSPNSQKSLEENARVWVFDPETLHWTHLDPKSETSDYPKGRTGHAAVAAPGGSIIIHGGYESPDVVQSDTWRFDLSHSTWTRLPALPMTESSRTASSHPPSLAIANEKLYLLNRSTDNLSMTLYTLDLPALAAVQAQQLDPASDLSSASWMTTSVPTNPLTPSPRLGNGACLLPISTGFGRSYLLHIMGTTGSDNGPESEYQSDIHALQLPSLSSTPASAKDTVRDHIPRADSHQLEWHAVTIVAKEEGSHPASWLETIDTHQQSVRSTVMNAASVAGEWVKGRARAVSNAAKDLHVGGLDEPESPSASKPPVLEDKEDKEKKAEVAAATGQQEHKRQQDEKDDVPLSSEVAHPINPGAETNAASGFVSGKSHPGPRGWFGAAVLGEPNVGTIGSGERPARVVMWGGVNAKGEEEGDGWVVEFRV